MTWLSVNTLLCITRLPITQILLLFYPIPLHYGIVQISRLKASHTKYSPRWNTIVLR